MLRFIIKLLASWLLLLILPSCARRDLSFTVDGEIEILAWSPDGHYLAIVPAGGTIHLWESSQNRVTQTIASPHDISIVAWSPDSTRLAASSWSGTHGMTDLLDIQSSEHTQSNIISESKAMSLGWSSLGSIISVSTRSRIAKGMNYTLNSHITRVITPATKERLSSAWLYNRGVRYLRRRQHPVQSLL
jgi:WD40 repeat protein